MDKKHQRTTKLQLQFYTHFCNEHPEFQAGKYSSRAPGRMQALWAELTQKLNAMHGPTRTPEKWKENLNHWKHQIRCRARKTEVHERTIDGDLKTPLSAIEQPVKYGNKNVITLGLKNVLDYPVAGSKFEADEFSSAPEEVNSRDSTPTSHSSARLRVAPKLSCKELENSIEERKKIQDANRKHQRTTQQQLQFYICFCKEHPELQGERSNTRAPGEIQELWAELAKKLNAIRGPVRTPEKWKENLNQWKYQIRCRARKAKVHDGTTDGLSEIEQLALYGHKNHVFDNQFDGNILDADKLFQTEDETEVFVREINNSTPIEDFSSATEEPYSRESTPVSSSSARFRVTPQLLYRELKKSIAKRDEMQERILQQQAETNAALRQMSEAVLALAQAIAKRDESK